MKHKVLVFVVGMEQTSFDGTIQMAKSIYDDETEFEKHINSLEGIGMYAVGVHIINTWIFIIDEKMTEKDIEEVTKTISSKSYFFRLASKDPSFKQFVGDLEI